MGAHPPVVPQGEAERQGGLGDGRYLGEGCGEVSPRVREVRQECDAGMSEVCCEAGFGGWSPLWCFCLSLHSYRHVSEDYRNALFQDYMMSFCRWHCCCRVNWSGHPPSILQK